MCCKKKQKSSAGMTLVELMVAIALLAVVFLAILRLCSTATMMAINSRKMSALVYAAEMKMEELIGLSREELLDAGLTTGGGCATQELALSGVNGTLGADADYWILLDDGTQPRDDGNTSNFIVTFHKEELSTSSEYVTNAELRAAYDNLVRITVTVREVQRASESVMSYTLTNVVYPAEEEVDEP